MRPISRSRRALCPLALVFLFASACTGRDAVRAPVDGQGRSERPIVYAAVGASETAGVGTDEPFRDAWPRVLWRALPEGSVLYDFGVGGSTARQALEEQAGAARAVKADLVTVWLNVNDLIEGVPPKRYGHDLRRIVHRLRRGGLTTVLVANTPRLDTLPLYMACRSEDHIYVAPSGGVVLCRQDILVDVPTPASVRADVDAYNAQIDRVVRREGAILVDLYALGDIPNRHPEYVSSDGFHPSTEGARAVAEAFERALAAAGD